MWARNIGAHLTGRASLDYRLRDATQLHRQVVGLLQDLDESVRDGEISCLFLTLLSDDNFLPLDPRRKYLLSSI